MRGTISKVTPSKGAQPGNDNAVRHGLRSGSVRFALGKLPKGMVLIERAVNQFRRLIEAAVTETHGVVSVYHAALIQSACRHETHAMMAKRWLRLTGDELDANQRLTYSKAVADASTARDKCLERLGLDAKSGDAFDAYYAGTLDVPAIEDQSTSITTTEGATNDAGR